jgi:pimeloyl-ACP methyl ester carboxylesterase
VFDSMCSTISIYSPKRSTHGRGNVISPSKVSKGAPAPVDRVGWHGLGVRRRPEDCLPGEVRGAVGGLPTWLAAGQSRVTASAARSEGQFRVVAWDAPGAGQSSDPPEGARLEDWAHWLAECIETLDLAPAHVAGLSFGAGLALELFQQHPEVVKSLILMSAYAGWGGSLFPDEVQARLELTRRNTESDPAQWAPALIQTLLPDGSEAELVDELTVMLTDFHAAATRTSL